MISVEKLRFSYKSNKEIFSGVDLRFGKGESWTIIGPSGCGKSTLLLILAGLTQPQEGKIVIAGKELMRPRPQTGLVLQDHGLLPWATVYENTIMGYKIRNFYGPDGIHSPLGKLLSQQEIDEKVEYWLTWLGLMDFRSMYPEQLSRGQRQRAAIARTLALEPDLLLMDEPFSALDAPIREDLQSVMNDFHRESGLTSITVTHDIEEAVVLGEKILVLSDKEAVAPQVIAGGFCGAHASREHPLFRERCGELRGLLVEKGER